jgi:hypothetical protein
MVLGLPWPSHEPNSSRYSAGGWGVLGEIGHDPGGMAR